MIRSVILAVAVALSLLAAPVAQADEPVRQNCASKNGGTYSCRAGYSTHDLKRIDGQLVWVPKPKSLKELRDINRKQVMERATGDNAPPFVKRAIERGHERTGN